MEQEGGKLLAISRRREGQVEVPAGTDLPDSEASVSPRDRSKRRRKIKSAPAPPRLPPRFSMQQGELFKRGSHHKRMYE